MSSQDFLNIVNAPGKSPWHDFSDSTKEQYFSMLNAEQANQHEIDMWHMNNEYNTPRKQMERLIEAGVNPAVAFNQVSSGTSSSAPGTHQSPTASFHDQADKLARVNTILGGIRDIMSTVGQGVQAAQGIQDMALRHQNNWFDKFRAKQFSQNTPFLFAEDHEYPGSVQVAPGLYASSANVQMFPEFYQGLKDSWKGGTYDLGVAAREDQHSLVQRRNRIDGLVQRIFEGIEKGASTTDLLKLFLELLAYTSIQNYGGGF